MRDQESGAAGASCGACAWPERRRGLGVILCVCVEEFSRGPSDGVYACVRQRNPLPVGQVLLYIGGSLAVEITTWPRLQPKTRARDPAGDPVIVRWSNTQIYRYVDLASSSPTAIHA